MLSFLFRHRIFNGIHMTPPSRPQIVFSGLNHNGGGRDHAEVICAGFHVYFICGRDRKECQKKYLNFTDQINSQTNPVSSNHSSFLYPPATYQQDHYQVDDLDTVAVA